MNRQKVTQGEKELIKKLSEYITFDKDKQIYDEGKSDFATLQMEGTAMALNRLNKFNIALLADEVGMGKTFQALAVVAEQFRQKPSSKVLIISPRKEVLKQWKEEEYNEFRNNHLLEKCLPENSDKNILEIENFANGFLKEKLEVKIVFAKATSFSTDENLNKRKNKLLEDIKKFDLIVIDEAHKFRNYNENSHDNENSSLIIKTAKMLFGNLKEDAKVLLMTATPLHSRNGDFLRILNLFKINNGNLLSIKNKYKGKNTREEEKEMLNHLMVRRLRVMSNGATKYDYRNEIAKSISLTDNENLRNELFFAMLQKEYVKSESSKNLSKSKYLLDFLEGTTFDENFKEENSDEEINEKNSELEKVLKEYENAYGKKEKPSNNKYKIVLEEISNILEKEDEKVLVFVRRRASAYEIARQYINEFDKKAWNLIDKTIDSTINIKMPKSRDEFEKIIKNYLEKNRDKEIEKILNSNLWKEEKNKEFVEKFRANPINIPEDKKYITTETAKKLIVSKYFEEYEEFKENRFIEFLEKIVSDLNSTTKTNYDEDENDKIPKSIILDFFKTKKGISSTHASRFLQKFSKIKSPYSKFFEEDFIEIYRRKNKTEIEKIEKLIQNVKLIKSAVLHASIGLIELYCCDIKAQQTQQKEKIKKQYNLFLEIVDKDFEKLTFIKQIDLFLENFEAYKKYLKFNENQQNNSEDDKQNDKSEKDDEMIFYDSQPAYPYVGGKTKNKTVIKRFNSPFFPKLLCGTSTLQEGVNLHLFCNKVFHFGAAHTMGDDEQRVGRVDRLMGKMDRELNQHKDGDPIPTLDIYYPYLKSTFDEFNLKKMLCKKRNTEKLIDRGDEIVNENDLEDELCDKNIEKLLRNRKRPLHSLCKP
jgi:superfamily II DNA or RNA helicase